MDLELPPDGDVQEEDLDVRLLVARHLLDQRFSGIEIVKLFRP